MPVNIGFVTGIILSGIIIISVIGNVLTLFVITRYQPLRNETGMFLANLAAADLLQSIFGMPLIAASAFHKQWLFGEALCTISGLTNSLFCITSVLTLTTVSVDRWLAIVYPLQYRTWLTTRRAGIALAYIWIHALLVALLPVFGWSRYVYLPYEFICTVQWEFNKGYTIFLSVTSFVTPLIAMVLCYSSVMKTARRKAREKHPVTVGWLSESDAVPGTSKEEEAHDKNCENPGKNVGGIENHAFIADSKDRKDKYGLEELYFNQGIVFQSESTPVKTEERHHAAVQGPSRDINIPDLAKMSTETRKDKASRLRSASILKRNGGKGKSPASVSSSSTSGITHLNPADHVVAKGNSKMAGKGKHPVGASITPPGRIGKSRVNPAGVVPPVINRWTQEISQRKELMVIPEITDEEKGIRKCSFSQTVMSTVRLPEHLARVRGWMTERKTEDGRQRRKEMKVTFILLVVNGTFILCWLPHFIGMMCLTFTNGSCPFPNSYHIITTTLAMMNSGCNPFIYTLTYRKFRKAFRTVLPCFRSNNAGNVETPVD